MKRAVALVGVALGTWACAGEPSGRSPTTAPLEAGSGVADTFNTSLPESGVSSMRLGRATSDAPDASNVETSIDSPSERALADPSDAGFWDGTTNATADSALGGAPPLDAAPDTSVLDAGQAPDADGATACGASASAPCCGMAGLPCCQQTFCTLGVCLNGVCR